MRDHGFAAEQHQALILAHPRRLPARHNRDACACHLAATLLELDSNVQLFYPPKKVNLCPSFSATPNSISASRAEVGCRVCGPPGFPSGIPVTFTRSSGRSGKIATNCPT